MASAASIDGQLWIAGGYSNGYVSDAWYSPDGVTWTQASAAATEYATYSAAMLPFRNTLYLLGGYGGSSVTRGVWAAPATPLTWNDNPTPDNGDALTANANDPADSGRTIVLSFR